jgi:hypothetical protein
MGALDGKIEEMTAPITAAVQRPCTISLGIVQIRLADRPGLGIRCTASDRHRPCDTGVNGPPMAHVLIASVIDQERACSLLAPTAAAGGGFGLTGCRNPSPRGEHGDAVLTMLHVRGGEVTRMQPAGGEQWAWSWPDVLSLRCIWCRSRRWLRLQVVVRTWSVVHEPVLL